MSVVQRPAIELETMDEVEREARALNLKDDPWGGEVLLSYRSVLKNRLDCLTTNLWRFLSLIILFLSYLSCYLLPLLSQHESSFFSVPPRPPLGSWVPWAGKGRGIFDPGLGWGGGGI